MSDIRRLHIICFDQPFPPTYGGIVDVFYKIVALHKAEVQLALHIFGGVGSKPSKELEKYAREIYYYPIMRNKWLFLSPVPYFIRQRMSRKLLKNLLLDNDPILFEGVHTCGIIDDPSLRNRLKIVRAHNVERDYYWALAKEAGWGKRKAILATEAFKLRLKEKYLLSFADRILALSVSDAQYFKNCFPTKDIRVLNCFFDVPELPIASNTPIIDGDYVLYHGNLQIPENERSASYILETISPHLGPEIKIVIAGHNPSSRLESKIAANSSARLLKNPSMSEMRNLVYYAKVHLMLTFQATGAKLKILNTLASSNGFCVANDYMLTGNRLSELCLVANEEEEIVATVKCCYFEPGPVGDEVICMRRDSLKALEYNDVRAILMDC